VNDQTPMPFGKYKGVKLEDVPAAYLLWMWDDGLWAQKDRPLHRYIANAFTVLETEATDYIVKRRPEGSAR
jgi:uncharacterized protein (DUF3820 family)